LSIIGVCGAGCGDFGLLTSRILIQFIAQIFALQYLRKHRAEIVRPFRMWLYPVPSVVAFIGWAYVFATSGWVFVGFGLLTQVAGILAYWIWTRFSAREPVQA
jgi:amino acid transporter